MRYFQIQLNITLNHGTMGIRVSETTDIRLLRVFVRKHILTTFYTVGVGSINFISFAILLSFFLLKPDRPQFSPQLNLME